MIPVFAPAVAGAATSSEVQVVLSEWIVKPKPKSVKAGTVKLVAKNVGGEVHELVVVRGKDPSALPTDANDAVDEAKIDEDDEVGEIEDIDPGKKKTVKFKLAKGKYILFCNITETEASGEVESHFAEGMVNTLKVP